jgi:uncharacterized membrane protein
MDDIPLLDGHGQMLWRWLHVIAGVLWIGLLWFFNWVNGAFAATMDGETKKKVVPELMPRALFWFRWGAAWTWIFGAMLLFLLYYMGPNTFSPLSEFVGEKPSVGTWIQPFAALFVGFIVYDLIFKTLPHTVGVILWGAIATGFAWYLSKELGFSGRAVLVHVGALFGTSMAANVWMRIWPAQQRIITAIKNGEAPDAADPAMAGLRSKHNTYMSVPLLLYMVSVDQAAMTGADPVMWVPITLVIGFAITYAIYKKVPSVKGF